MLGFSPRIIPFLFIMLGTQARIENDSLSMLDFLEKNAMYEEDFRYMLGLPPRGMKLLLVVRDTHTCMEDKSISLRDFKQKYSIRWADVS